MAEYIEKEVIINKCKEHRDFYITAWGSFKAMPADDKKVCDAYATCWSDVVNAEAADVQEKKYCRMIPLEPDCRDCTDVFICTNCHHHIHLGFIRKEYSGSYCLECGAEVMDGDAE